ncbi:MAG: hypothetical protein ACOC2J_04025, partial [bacterium]
MERSFILPDKEIELIATTTFGLESLVKREVSRLGYKINRVENGQVCYTA